MGRAGKRNADVAAAASALQMRIEQLQFVSLAEQREHVLVIADVPNNDAAQCGRVFSSGCARVFQLRAPAPSWKLSGFDVASPGVGLDPDVGTVVDDDQLGSAIRFHLLAASATLPRPFDDFAATFKTFDPELTANCAGSRKCVAFRFRTNGQVSAEPPDPAAPPAARSGHALALGSDLTGSTGGARQVGILVAVPSGIVRTFAVP